MNLVKKLWHHILCITPSEGKCTYKHLFDKSMANVNVEFNVHLLLRYLLDFIIRVYVLNTLKLLWDDCLEGTNISR